MRRGVLAIVFFLAASAARAQSPYVAATVGADVSRVSHAESNIAGGGSSSGSEVISWSLRAGTEIGQNWGAELEFVRSGESHSSRSIGGPVPLGGFVTLTPGTPGATPGVALPTSIPFPIGGFQTDIRRSHSDLDAVLWARQRVGGSIDLVFLGGVAFSRERIEITQTFPAVLRVLLPISAGNFRTTSVSYGTRPLIGAEARIGLTSHVRLVPGVRLQGIESGWLLRPYAGLGWFF